MSSLGASVRRAFSPYEREIAELYRRLFMNLDDLTARICDWTAPQSTLEIGCGEGALDERLVQVFPKSRLPGDRHDLLPGSSLDLT